MNNEKEDGNNGEKGDARCWNNPPEAAGNPSLHVLRRGFTGTFDHSANGSAFKPCCNPMQRNELAYLSESSVPCRAAFRLRRLSFERHARPARGKRVWCAPHFSVEIIDFAGIIPYNTGNPQRTRSHPPPDPCRIRTQASPMGARQSPMNPRANLPANKAVCPEFFWHPRTRASSPPLSALIPVEPKMIEEVLHHVRQEKVHRCPAVG